MQFLGCYMPVQGYSELILWKLTGPRLAPSAMLNVGESRQHDRRRDHEIGKIGKSKIQMMKSM